MSTSTCVVIGFLNLRNLEHFNLPTSLNGNWCFNLLGNEDPDKVLCACSSLKILRTASGLLISRAYVVFSRHLDPF